MCDWGGGPLGITGYGPPEIGHHESDREMAERQQPPPEHRVTPKFCYNCGGELQPKYNFCTNCGVAVERA